MNGPIAYCPSCVQYGENFLEIRVKHHSLHLNDVTYRLNCQCCQIYNCIFIIVYKCRIPYLVRFLTKISVWNDNKQRILVFWTKNGKKTKSVNLMHNFWVHFTLSQVQENFTFLKIFFPTHYFNLKGWEKKSFFQVLYLIDNKLIIRTYLHDYSGLQRNLHFLQWQQHWRPKWY